MLPPTTPRSRRHVLALDAFRAATLLPGARVLEVGYLDRDRWQERRIPGSRYLDTCELEVPPLWNRRRAAELLRRLARQDLLGDGPLLLASRDPMAQYRVGVLLDWLGLGPLRFLDGGSETWHRARLPSESGPPVPIPTPGPVGLPRPRRARILDRPQVAARLADPDFQLVDVRSLAERRGLTSGYAEIESRGTIPGSIWGGGGSSATELEDLRDRERRMADPARLARLWQDLGLDPAREICFFCGTGWRASEAYWYARELGFPRVSLYDGGWFEWSRTAA